MYQRFRVFFRQYGVVAPAGAAAEFTKAQEREGLAQLKQRILDDFRPERYQDLLAFFLVCGLRPLFRASKCSLA